MTLVSNDVFCVELLEGFTVRVTLERLMKNGIEKKESLVIEFHSIVCKRFFAHRRNFLMKGLRTDYTIGM